MEILKGMVKDNGYPDTEISYVKIDDNTMYYLIENGNLENGGYIASPVLKEAIQHVPFTSLGVIDKDGKVLIPFENKAINKVKDKLLLVEKNAPVTDSVVKALSDKNDPNNAAVLDDNASKIKQQITNIIGMSGEFIFDNQFSEATLYTMDGVNVSGGYYSFIAELNSDYYFATNVLGNQIIKFNPASLEQPAIDNIEAANDVSNEVEIQQPVDMQPQTQTEVPTQQGVENTNTQEIDDSVQNMIENQLSNINQELGVNEETTTDAPTQEQEEVVEQPVADQTASEVETTDTTYDEDNQVENTTENEMAEQPVADQTDAITAEDQTASEVETTDAAYDEDNQVEDTTESEMAEQSEDVTYEENEDTNEEINNTEDTFYNETDDEKENDITTNEFENYDTEMTDNELNPVIGDATKVINNLLKKYKEREKECYEQKVLIEKQILQIQKAEDEKKLLTGKLGDFPTILEENQKLKNTVADLMRQNKETEQRYEEEAKEREERHAEECRAWEQRCKKQESLINAYRINEAGMDELGDVVSKAILYSIDEDPVKEMDYDEEPAKKMSA